MRQGWTVACLQLVSGAVELGRLIASDQVFANMPCMRLSRFNPMILLVGSQSVGQ